MKALTDKNNYQALKHVVASQVTKEDITIKFISAQGNNSPKSSLSLTYPCCFSIFLQTCPERFYSKENISSKSATCYCILLAYSICRFLMHPTRAGKDIDLFKDIRFI